MTYTIQPPQWVAGGLSAVIAYFAPIASLLICAVVFVGVDFILGVWASYARAKRSKSEWRFESSKAWNTILKLVFIMGGIILSWMLDAHILGFLNLNLAKIFTGFVCGVEFWSYLENASEISNHPIFRAVKKIMKNKVDNALDIDDKDNG